jgi:hypothetical protein
MTGINTIAFTPRKIQTLNASVTTANTDLTGASGSVIQFKNTNAAFTTGTDGSLLINWTVNYTVTSTAGQIMLFIKDGTTFWLVDAMAVTAISVAAGTIGFQKTNTLNLYVPFNYTLYVSTYKSEVAHVTANVLDY